MYLDYLEWTWYILHMFFLLFPSVLLCCTSQKGSNVVYSMLYMMYLHIQMMGFKCMQKNREKKKKRGGGGGKRRGGGWKGVGGGVGNFVRQCKTMCYNGE